MQKSSTPPDEHLASLADDVRDDMRTLDARIAEAMAGEERVLWEGKFWGGSDQRIIGYGEYTYKGRSGRSGTWFVVGLAAQKNYITVFVNAVEDGVYLTERYADRLGKVKVGRSSISFKNLGAVDLDTLVELVASARKASAVAST
jgi:Domain of unknown function (DU1801)